MSAVTPPDDSDLSPLERLLRARGLFDDAGYQHRAFTRVLNRQLRQGGHGEVNERTVQSWVRGHRPRIDHRRMAVYTALSDPPGADADVLVRSLVLSWERGEAAQRRVFHELGSRLPAGASPERGESQPEGPLSQADLDRYVEQACDVVAAQLKQTNGHYGWSHHLDFADESVSAIGTAYGLRTLSLSPRHRALLDLERLRGTLLALRNSDDGWASKSQAGPSRPEATAIVLRGLATTGALPDESVSRLAALVADSADQMMHRTSALTIVLGPLCLGGRGDDAGRVARTLEDAANRAGEHAYWGGLAERGSWWRLPQTARAVIALGDFYGTAHSLRPSVELLSKARAWLAHTVTAAPSWFPSDGEVFGRPVAGGARGELLSLRHFTPALVLRALRPAVPETAAARRWCVDATLRCREEQVWRWPEDYRREPIWMTLQSLVALGCNEVPAGGPP